MQTPIVRAVDVGFGNVKYTTASSQEERGMGARLFPSLVAPPAAVTAGADLISGRRATVMVQVDGATFEVGPDVERVIGTRDSRVLHRDYTGTAEYKALLLGSLTYMGVEAIDLLVLGLPVNAPKEKYAVVRERFIGELEVANGRRVAVRDVEVIAQPMGSFLAYAWDHGLLGRIRDQNTLIIDVGFFTLDWVVMRGSEPSSARTGGYDAGVSEVLRRVNEAVKSELQCDDVSINRLDQGLRDGRIRLYGREYPMSRFLPAAAGAISEGLNAMLGKIGSSDDIDAIYLSGGGAALYAEAVRRAFPKHEVRTVGDAIYSNVRGFQVFGELKAARKARVAA